MTTKQRAQQALETYGCQIYHDINDHAFEFHGTSIGVILKQANGDLWGCTVNMVAPDDHPCFSYGTPENALRNYLR